MKTYNASLYPNIAFEDAKNVVAQCGAVVEGGIPSSDGRFVFVIVTFSCTDEKVLAKVRDLPCVVAVSENTAGNSTRH